MKHSQTVRHVKQKNITFYTVANMKKKGRCYLKQKKLQKNSQYIITLIMEDVLGEENFMHDDCNFLREAFEKYINATKKGF